MPLFGNKKKKEEQVENNSEISNFFKEQMKSFDDDEPEAVNEDDQEYEKKLNDMSDDELLKEADRDLNDEENQKYIDDDIRAEEEETKRISDEIEKDEQNDIDDDDADEFKEELEKIKSEIAKEEEVAKNSQNVVVEDNLEKSAIDPEENKEIKQEDIKEVQSEEKSEVKHEEKSVKDIGEKPAPQKPLSPEEEMYSAVMGLQNYLGDIRSNNAVKNLASYAEAGIVELQLILTDPKKEANLNAVKLGIASLMMQDLSANEQLSGNNKIGNALSKNKKAAIGTFAKSKVVEELAKKFVKDPGSLVEFSKNFSSNIKKANKDFFAERKLNKELSKNKTVSKDKPQVNGAENKPEKKNVDKETLNMKVVSKLEFAKSMGMNNSALSPYMNKMFQDGISELELLFVDSTNPNLNKDFVKQGIAAIMMSEASASERNKGKNRLGKAMKQNPQKTVDAFLSSDVVEQFAKELIANPAKIAMLLKPEKVKILNAARSKEAKEKLKQKEINKVVLEEQNKLKENPEKPQNNVNTVPENKESEKTEPIKEQKDLEKKELEVPENKEPEKTEPIKEQKDLEKKDLEASENKESEKKEAVKEQEVTENNELKESTQDQKAIERENIFERGLKKTEILRTEADAMKPSFRKDITSKILESRDELTNLVGRKELDHSKVNKAIATIMVCSSLKDNMPDFDDLSTDFSREFVDKKINELLENPAFQKLVLDADSDMINNFLEGKGEKEFLNNLIKESQRMYEAEERAQGKIKEDIIEEKKTTGVSLF